MLHQVVREHQATLFAEARARTASGLGYPKYVIDEFAKYIECGILAYGFLRVRCGACRDEQVVAFSCKGRVICPSCTGRRMSDITAHLVDNVLPRARYRQWTLSVPWKLRVLLIWHPDLVTLVQARLVRVLTNYWRRRAREVLAVRGVLRRGATLQSGAVVAIQRFGSRLNLHVHVHLVMPDCVWQRMSDGTLMQLDLAPPTDEDVMALVRTVCRKVTLAVEKWHTARGDAEPSDEDAADVAALVLADIPKSPPRIDEVPSEPVTRRLAAMCDGYSLECKPNVAPHDRAGLERLLRYGARPPFAHARLERLPDGRVSYRLPKPFYTGQTHVILAPVDFLRRLAALIPPPRMHTIRYHGLFASANKDRKTACALAPGPASPTDACVHEPVARLRGDPDRDAPYRKRTRTAWAALLKRVFGSEALVCHCGGTRKVICALTRSQSPEPLRRYLEHIGEAADPPASAPARAPPQAELAFGEPDTPASMDAVDAEPNWDAHFTD